MADTIRRELIYLWYYFDIQFRQIFFYWALGILIGSFVSVFLKQYIHGRMASLGEKKMEIWGILPASALGIAIIMAHKNNFASVLSNKKSLILRRL